jgi:hypothetical protein
MTLPNYFEVILNLFSEEGDSCRAIRGEVKQRLPRGSAT